MLAFRDPPNPACQHIRQIKPPRGFIAPRTFPHMSRQEATIEELVTMIENGQIRLPEMQRRYVWRAPRVRDLLDSLYRGYPSGAILLWESSEDVPEQEAAVSQAKSPYSDRKLLLDGQQRLTSLTAVLRGKKVTVRGRKRPIDLLFNLDHPDTIQEAQEVFEEADDDLQSEDAEDSSADDIRQRVEGLTFTVATNSLASQPNWVRVSEVFKTNSDSVFLKQAGIGSFDDPNYEKYTQRLARLRDIKKYTYRMDVLPKELSYEEVTEIFVRVNSLGAKLRGSDLALAQITAKWPNSLTKFLEFQRQCDNQGYPLDLGSVHLRTMVAFATGQSRFRRVSNIPRAELEPAWERTQAALEYSIDFIKKNVGVESPALLASPYICITVAYFYGMRDSKIASDEASILSRWALLASAKGRYSRGSSETLLDQDLRIIKEGRHAAELIEQLRLQVGRLEILTDDLEGLNQRSSLFKAMFLAFQAAGAQDWKSKLAISLSHAGTRNRLQFHHIWPKARLKSKYAAKEINDISNLCFISGKLNREIRDRAPADYLRTILDSPDASILESQCIPTDPSLLESDAYPEFIAARRALIAARLNTFLLGEPCG